MSSDLLFFIGLVTHSNSRFNIQGESESAFRALSESLSSGKLQIQELISDRDDFDASQKISFSSRVKSAWVQASIERAWSKHVSSYDVRPRRSIRLNTALQLGMFVKRCSAYIFDPNQIKRLINIDLSHLRLLKAGIDAGASWILILEDDARAVDVSLASGQIIELLDFLPTDQLVFVNLSRSMDPHQLGVSSVLEGANNVCVLRGEQILLELPIPVTNTVCANLYSAKFAAQLVENIEDSSLFPSIPIDWRLNKFLMAEDRRSATDKIRCFWLMPGSFEQSSMHGLSDV